MARPFRCHNRHCSTDRAGRLMFDFWAERPGQGWEAVACPKCGCNQESGAIIALAIIHFDPPTKLYGKGLNTLACNPNTPIAGKHASSHPSAVNCPACKLTPAFLKAQAEHDGDEEYVAPQDHDEEASPPQGAAPVTGNAAPPPFSSPASASKEG